MRTFGPVLSRSVREHRRNRRKRFNRKFKIMMGLPVRRAR